MFCKASWTEKMNMNSTFLSSMNTRGMCGNASRAQLTETLRVLLRKP